MVRIDSNGTKSKPTLKKFHKNNQDKNENAFKKTPGGGIEKVKSKRPFSKGFIKMNRDARKALATGEVASQEIKKKMERDLRTMYIRFKNADERPSTEDDIRTICPSVSFVRTPRQGKRKIANNIKFAYLEFDSESSCVQAKEELSKFGDKYFVDFVGEKSRNVKSSSKTETKSRPINPMRLFVSNLPPGFTVPKLKQLFPKCTEASVVMKGSPVGFVQFSNAGDTKSAFDAAQNLSKADLPPGVPKMTVLYAKMAKRQSTLKRDDQKKSKVEQEATDEMEVKQEESEDEEAEVEEAEGGEVEEAEGEEESDVGEEDNDVENDEDSEAEEEAEDVVEAEKAEDDNEGEEDAEAEAEEEDDVENDEDTDDEA